MHVRIDIILLAFQRNWESDMAMLSLFENGIARFGVLGFANIVGVCIYIPCRTIVDD